jgi:RNA polymerase sigma-70 factor (ECF subfamily)
MDAQDLPKLEVLAHQTDWIRRLARGLVADEDRADDVMQQTLLRALETPPRDERNVTGWLATVARNVARRMRVVDTRRMRREQLGSAHESLPSAGDVVAKVEMLRHVSSAVLGVREPYRTVLLLRYYEDLAPRDIAARLHAPIDTVRSQLKRGLAVVRERLDRAHGDSREWLHGLLAAAGLPAATTPTMITSTSTANFLGALLIMDKSTKLILAAILIVSGAVVTWRVLGHTPEAPPAPRLVNAEELPRRKAVHTEAPAREAVAVAEPSAPLAPSAAPAPRTPTDSALDAIRDRLDADSFSHLTGWDESPALVDLVAALRDGVLDAETCAHFLETRIGQAVVVPGTEETKSSSQGTSVAAMLVYPTGLAKPAAAPCSARYDPTGTLEQSSLLINIRESSVPGLDPESSDVKLSVWSTRQEDGSLRTSFRIQVSSGFAYGSDTTEEQKLAAQTAAHERQKDIDRMFADGRYGRPYEILLTRESGEGRFTSYDGANRTTAGSQPVNATTTASFWRLFEHMGEMLPDTRR